MGISLRDKYYGCICGSHIGSAMGAQVEDMPYAEIEEKYGTVESFHAYEHYHNGWIRKPGTTEDGIERQKLMITAIMEKGDRVNAEDVKRAWIRHIKPASIGMISEPFEAKLLAMAQAGIPAHDIGKYCDYAGLNSFARACHPIGLINAGDVQGAVNDVLEVGQLYQTANSRGLKWAMVTAVAIAAATKTDATLESVLDTIFDTCDSDLVVKELEKQLNNTEKCEDFRQLRAAFDDIYHAIGIPYANSFAREVVTKAVCIFRMVKGNTRQAIIASVNMGRDTDCTAAVAAGICGALTGAASIPDEWIRQVDYATEMNPYTNAVRTMRENSDGLYEAFKARLKKMAAYVKTMDH